MVRLSMSSSPVAAGLQVSAFCSVLDKDLTQRSKTSEVNLSPLLIQSYTTLINQELERRLKQVCVYMCVWRGGKHGSESVPAQGCACLSGAK